MIYVRWKKDEPRTGRVFPPLGVDHPMYLDPCANPACEAPLGDGTPVQLLVIGPDADYVKEHHAGKWYAAVAVAAHTRCLGTEEQP